MQVFTRPRAAALITERGLDMSAQALADLASDGKGPAYSIINGRACYTEASIDAWLSAEAARPVTRRRHQIATEREQVA